MGKINESFLIMLTFWILALFGWVISLYLKKVYRNSLNKIEKYKYEGLDKKLKYELNINQLYYKYYKTTKHSSYFVIILGIFAFFRNLYF